MSSSSSNIYLNCFVCGDAENNIFPVEIDNNLTIDTLKDSIKNIQYNKNNFDLYKVDFFQPNFSIVSSVNSFTDHQEVFMESQRENSYYFSTLYIDTLKEKCPYH